MTESQPEQSKSDGKSKRRADDLAFHPSPSPTIGVELELQLLDRDTGDLAPGAVRILKACAEQAVPGVTAELMQSMIEIKTTACQSVAESREQILTTLRRVRSIAEAQGYHLAMGATHPTHRTTGSAVYPSERYDRILNRLAWVGYQWVAFGLHVHVGVPSGDVAMGAISMLVQYLPHLLAVSANSPFWQGIDTGLASARSALYHLIPHSGIPHYFKNWKEFRSFYRLMKGCKAIASYKDIYWDLRPRPDFGTIEFRICDVPGSISQVCSLVALCRTLVISAQRMLEEHPQLLRGDRRRHWIAIENKWLATRYGLEAPYIRTPGGKRGQLRQELADLIARLKPIAQEVGDESYLAALEPVDQFESGSERQRRLFREGGDWKAVVADMQKQLADELETKPQAAS